MKAAIEVGFKGFAGQFDTLQATLKFHATVADVTGIKGELSALASAKYLGEVKGTLAETATKSYVLTRVAPMVLTGAAVLACGNRVIDWVKHFF